MLAADFGDAPFPYPTLLQEDGPQHVTDNNSLFLGSQRTEDTDGNHADEDIGDDGVVFGSLTPGQQWATATVTASDTGLLDGWIDFNGDGSWQGPGEQIFDQVPVDPGVNELTFHVPGFTRPGTNYARFRLSSAGDLGLRGEAADGEVEDYQVTIAPNSNTGGEFSAAREIHTALIGPTDAVTADLDGDGDLDVLSAAQFGGAILWHENGGSQDFTTSEVVTGDDLSATYSIAVADMDGDGDQDILAVSAPNQVTWYENDGAQVFSPHRISDEVDAPKRVIAFDMDGDGDLDAASASYYDDKIAWYENDGDGNFTTHVVTEQADGARDVYAADLDRDGDMDLVSGSVYDNSVAWYENTGDQNFTPHTVADDVNGPYSVFASDINGDGDIDLVAASRFDNRVLWYVNDSTGGFSEQTITFGAGNVARVSAGDVDGDGDLDILAASAADDKITWYNNDGGVFDSVDVTVEADGANVVIAADLDNDGDLDLVSASNQDGRIAWYENGNSAPPPTVLNVELNAGQVDPPDRPTGPAPATWASQRSALVNIKVTFSEPVFVSPAGVRLTNLGINAPVDEDVEVFFDSSDFQLEGSELTINLPFQMPDGVYQLELLSSIVSQIGTPLDGNGDTNPGDPFVMIGSPENGLYKLNADWSGDGGTTIFDFSTFAYWFSLEVPTAPRYMDLNGDSGVSIFDFPFFASAFGNTITFPHLEPRADRLAVLSFQADQHEHSNSRRQVPEGFRQNINRIEEQIFGPTKVDGPQLQTIKRKPFVSRDHAIDRTDDDSLEELIAEIAKSI